MVDPGGSQWWILGDRSCEIHVDPSNGSWGALIGETSFLGRDLDQEIRLIKTHYETETEK